MHFDIRTCLESWSTFDFDKLLLLVCEKEKLFFIVVHYTKLNVGQKFILHTKLRLNFQLQLCANLLWTDQILHCMYIVNSWIFRSQNLRTCDLADFLNQKLNVSHHFKILLSRVNGSNLLDKVNRQDMAYSKFPITFFN